MNLFQTISNYQPYDEAEVADKAQFLKFIETFDDVLTRENIFGHFCASAFVVNPARDKAIMVYHNIYDGWIIPGGHADGEVDLLGVALREIKEETNLDARPLLETPFAIQTDAIMGHVKKGEYVSSHLHFNVVYLLEAEDAQNLAFREDESQGVNWFPFADFTNPALVVPFAINIHRRMVDKLKTLGV